MKTYRNATALLVQNNWMSNLNNTECWHIIVNIMLNSASCEPPLGGAGVKITLKMWSQWTVSFVTLPNERYLTSL